MMIVPRRSSAERSLKDLERQDKTALWEVAKETIVDPATQMPQIDHTAIFKDLVEAYGGDRRMVTPPAGMGGGGMGSITSLDGEVINPQDVDALPDPEAGKQPYPTQVGEG
jgi:hypothetical protein